jgi:hypothetical protein
MRADRHLGYPQAQLVSGQEKLGVVLVRAGQPVKRNAGEGFARANAETVMERMVAGAVARVLQACQREVPRDAMAPSATEPASARAVASKPNKREPTTMSALPWSAGSSMSGISSGRCPPSAWKITLWRAPDASAAA